MLRPPTMKRSNSDGSRRKVKKLVVSMKKKKPKLPANFEENTWRQLSAAVAAVHAQTATEYGREELYNAVENMCVHKLSASMLEKLRVMCESHIEGLVKSLQDQSPDVASFLRAVDNTWDTHCNQMRTIRNIFLYLDRTVVSHTPDKSLWELGLQLFAKHLRAHVVVLTRVVEGTLSTIEAERNGESVDRSLMRNLLRMWTSLRLYHDTFENQFLEQSAVYYQQEAVKSMSSTTVPDYLLRVEKRFEEESDRVGAYLDHTTRRPLIVVLEQQMLQSQAAALLDKGFVGLLDDNRVADLQRMYAMFGRVDAVDLMNTHFAKYCKAKGLAVVSDPEKDKEMVKALLELRLKLDTLHANAFNRDDKFKYAIKDAFENFINVRSNKPAEMIAKFVDKQLRSGKGGSEAEVEALLDRVMQLFRSINGKDVFEAFYKKDLAKRLLLNKSASADLERSMLSKLKTECGNAFTTKLEGMFKDVELSKQLMTEFKTSAPYRSAAEAASAPSSSAAAAGAGALPPPPVVMDITVHVLTTTHWPGYPPCNIKMPPQLAVSQKAFEEFYAKKFTGRQLTWQHSLGHCAMAAFFPLGKKELQVSLYQACVLLLFNDMPTMSYSVIKENSGIDEEPLKRTLLALACGKVRVLTKLPKSKKITDKDTFTFNESFKAKLRRLKINAIQMKETKKEQSETNERVFRARQFLIDAAIVRIMKTRKRMSHTNLMAELLSQLRFPAEPALVKKRIASLLDREYIERDEDAPGFYLYLA